MRCGNCKGDHDTVAEVRDCYGAPAQEAYTVPSKKQVEYVLGLQEQRDLPDEYDVHDDATLGKMDRAEVSRLIEELKALPYKKPKADIYKPMMPAGRYAIKVDGVWMFYQVDDGKGRWEGYKFIVRLAGAPGSYQKIKLGATTRTNVFKAIQRDPKQAMEDYGKQSGVCGRCSSPLTDPQSLALGIGPKCRQKSGWY